MRLITLIGLNRFQISIIQNTYEMNWNNGCASDPKSDCSYYRSTEYNSLKTFRGCVESLFRRVQNVIKARDHQPHIRKLNEEYILL